MCHYYTKFIMGFLLLFITPFCFASNPASQAYVDRKAADLQTQIDSIRNNPINKLKIGDCYQGGIIYYLDNASRKGFIVALTDSSSGGGPFYDWQLPTSNVATSQQLFTGQQNTALMTNSPAAIAATQPHDGFSDWYLPSQSELMVLFAVNDPVIESSTCPGNIPLITSPTNVAAYWCSTQRSSTTAYLVNFDSGQVGNDVKDPSQQPQPRQGYRVRPIRTFNY